MFVGTLGVSLGAAVIVIVVVALWLAGPLEAVTVTVYVPGIVDLQDKLAVPGPVTVLGLIGLQFKPEGTVSVKTTVSVNPLTAPIVIVDMADEPVLADAGLAVRVKPGETGLEKMFVDCILTSEYST
jgi:hypothetical protein